MFAKLEAYYHGIDNLDDCSLEFILSAKFSDFDELVHKSVLEDIERDIRYYMTKYRDEDSPVDPRDFWKCEASQIPTILPQSHYL